MKIYGNSQSDHFGVFLTVIGGVSVAAGFGLAHVGGMSILASLVVFGGAAFGMVKASSRWDLMSDAAPVTGADLGVPVRLPNFPVKADTEAQAALPTWTPAANDTVLPSPVEKPKTNVITNTAVAA